MSDKRTKLVLNLNEDINDCLWLSLFNEESSEDIFTFHNKHETNPFLHFSDIDISDFNPKWIQNNRKSKREMLIAVEGCCHGELDKIYETLEAAGDKFGAKVDLLLCCGDFQSIRDANDLSCLACPEKYRHMGDFHKYYTGEKKAPILTVFIGGNHEASNYLWETYYGGWVAENIYYLGMGGIININGLTIGGISGIYKEHDHRKGFTERPPYNSNSMRSIFHVRDFEISKLLLYGLKPNVMMSHDWPCGIDKFGNTAELLRRKSQFEDEVRSGCLGSPANMKLLKTMRPQYWFAGHLHCKFGAVVDWSTQQPASSEFTKFLALDKCLPRRSFLQIVKIEKSELNYDPTEYGHQPGEIYRDVQWLAVLKGLNNHIPIDQENCSVTDEMLKTYAADVRIAMKDLKDKHGDQRFFKVEDWDPDTPNQSRKWLETDNKQTSDLCSFLGIDNRIRRTRCELNRHLKGTSVEATKTQLSHIESGVSSANRLLEELLSSPQPVSAAPIQRNQPVVETAQASPAPKNDEGEGDVFEAFIDI